MKRVFYAIAISFLVLVCCCQSVAFAETDYKKIGVFDDTDIYLDKKSIIYYDDFIVISGKLVCHEGYSRVLNGMYTKELYFQYALAKSAHSYKLLHQSAEAMGCVKTDNQGNKRQMRISEWLEENWEYTEEDFHKRFDYSADYDINRVRWTNFGSNDKVMTLVYDEAMKLAGIKNKHELEDSGTNDEATRAASRSSASSSSNNMLLVVLAAAVGILGTVIFMQHKNSKYDSKTKDTSQITQSGVNKYTDIAANVVSEKQVGIATEHKFCRKCGTKVDKDSKFCPKCGEKF